MVARGPARELLFLAPDAADARGGKGKVMHRFWLLAICLLAGSGPALAEMGFYGWGPRLGAGDDPDQILVGIHQDLGEIVENLRFQPSLDLGFGDDQTLVSGVLPVHYRLLIDGKATPYLGGGLLLAWIDRDLPGRRGDESDFEIAPILVAGVEWQTRRAADLLLEIQLPGGDGHDAKLLVGWVFRAR